MMMSARSAINYVLALGRDITEAKSTTRTTGAIFAAADGSFPERMDKNDFIAMESEPGGFRAAASDRRGD